MVEVTRVINAQITIIGEFEECVELTKKENLAKHLKRILMADDVVVESVKDFVIDKED